MEGGNLQKSPQVGYPADSGEAKYVSGLSTILVASIQEAKDRISQIEYIFCSQLYPNFQSKSKSLQKIYSDARQAAEDCYKEKEENLLLQIEKLKEELKEKTTEVNVGKEAHDNLENLLRSKDQMLVNKENRLKELEEANEGLVRKQNRLVCETERLQSELMKKSKEDDREAELQEKLLQLVQSKVSLVAHKDKLLMEHEQKEMDLITELESTRKRVDELQCEVKEKTAEIDRGRLLQGNLLKNIESKDSEIMQNEHVLRNYTKENGLLKVKVENLEYNIAKIQKELQGKVKELEDGGKLQEQLLQQNELYKSEQSKPGRLLEDLEKENMSLHTKLKAFQEKVDKLQESIREKSNESYEGMELHGKLLQQIKSRDSELLSEKHKRKDLLTAYKKLKSQYNFLCTKLSPTKRNEATRHNQNPVTSPDMEYKTEEASDVACEVTKQKASHDMMEDGKGFTSVQQTDSATPTTNYFIAPKCPTDVKSCPPAGTKRSASYWRDTRSHQSRNGHDLHEDFLDTPLENIRGYQGKATKDGDRDISAPVPKDMSSDNSDDETQDMDVNPGPQKEQLPPSRPGASSFKFVEPVRKKAERENLKGIECKQCKKFYDAVLSNDGRDSNGNKQNIRCEHHEGVSRHRYRYAPPLTPDGFWNIGFESEM